MGKLTKIAATVAGVLAGTQNYSAKADELTFLVRPVADYELNGQKYVEVDGREKRVDLYFITTGMPNEQFRSLEFQIMSDPLTDPASQGNYASPTSNPRTGSDFFAPNYMDTSFTTPNPSFNNMCYELTADGSQTSSNREMINGGVGSLHYTIKDTCQIGQTITFSPQEVRAYNAQADEYNFENGLNSVSEPVITTNAKADTNCDRTVDFFDIDPFLMALFTPTAYQTTYPNCSPDTADVNRDGTVDFFDIDPFLTRLFSQ